MMREIKEYEGFYRITEAGKIYGIKRGEYKTPSLGNHGYLVVDLYKNNKRTTALVHRIVAETFIENPEDKKTVNHKNGNKKDNRVENLEWNTYSENHEHSYSKLDRTAWMKGRFGSKNHNSKKVVMMDLHGKDIREFDSIRCAERELGILNNAICACLKGRSNSSGGYKWRYKNEP